MTKQQVVIGAILFGFLLLGLSAVWPSWFTSRENFWTEEQQEGLAEATRHAHELDMRRTFRPGTSEYQQEVQQQEFEAAQAHLEAQVDKLKQAKEYSHLTPRILFWLGMLTVVGGVAAYRFL